MDGTLNFSNSLVAATVPPDVNVMALLTLRLLPGEGIASATVEDYNTYRGTGSIQDMYAVASPVLIKCMALTDTTRRVRVAAYSTVSVEFDGWTYGWIEDPHSM